MLGGFQTAKCVEHCFGKYIWHGENPQTQKFGVNVVDTVLNGTNYERSLKG